MTDGLNRVTLLGNVTQDAELREVISTLRTSVLKFSLAINESYLDRNKVRQERTEFANIVLWGKRAESLAQHVVKGTRLLVEGSLRTSSYDDRDGNKRRKTEVVATNVVFAGGGGRRDRCLQHEPSEHEWAKQDGYQSQDDDYDDVQF